MKRKRYKNASVDANLLLRFHKVKTMRFQKRISVVSGFECVTLTGVPGHHGVRKTGDFELGGRAAGFGQSSEQVGERVTKCHEQ